MQCKRETYHGGVMASWVTGLSPLDFLLCYCTKPLVYNRVKPEIGQ
jgi:hypothetical protein